HIRYMTLARVALIAFVVTLAGCVAPVPAGTPVPPAAAPTPTTPRVTPTPPAATPAAPATAAPPTTTSAPTPPTATGVPPTPMAAPTPRAAAPLQDAVQAAIGRHQGTIGVAVTSLSSPQVFAVNADRRFRSASLYKL